MKRILAVLLFYFIASPALATPLYAGIQIGDDSAGVLFGFRINQTYAVETHYTKSNASSTNAGLTVDTASTGVGVVGLAMFPMKLGDVAPYDLFVKAGYQHTSSTDTYSIPTSVTLTQPYSGTLSSQKNQLIFGAGAEFGFAKYLTGRAGLDFIGKKRHLNLGFIFRF
ncbi:MAG: hypothetical protein HZB47_03960 [Nitrosomonadales bacterium]|nr:hypothetical protein [Nitrosomonadales bacterium]